MARALWWILCACFAAVGCAASDLPPLADDTTCSIPEESRLGRKSFEGGAWSEGCSQKDAVPRFLANLRMNLKLFAVYFESI